MKVLYISHYKEASGWGQVARDYILALDKIGINVVPRAIKLGNSNAKLPTRLIELEQKDVKNCNICIQHVLPHFMKYDNYFEKNIGFFELETTNIEHTSWVHHLNLMDEIWVPCSDMLHIHGVNKPIKLVPHTFNLSNYKQYDKLNIPQLQNHFVFYFIGEFNIRKHWGALLRAFHTEFHPSEPVRLVIKTSKPGIDSNTLAQEITQFCGKIKSNLRIFEDVTYYSQDIIITVNTSYEDLLRLHASCDCFVCPSYGEAFCVPAWEAMAMGNIVISSTCGGMKDYIDSERNGFLVKGNMEPVFGQHETISEFGSSLENWFDISINDLRKTMRRVYELSNNDKQKIKHEAKLSAAKNSYEHIGNLIKELLSV